MRILSITAQKPHSTGSGVYLTELVKAFDKLGHEQAVVAGIYHEDIVEFSDNIVFCPVYYHSEELPYSIAGMSDEMPYESTMYRQMTEEMVQAFEQCFIQNIRKVIETFKPDLILCHHLYLLTAFVRKHFQSECVMGICHGSDIRQIQKNPLKQEFIKSNIQALTKVFALHEAQKQEISRTYGIEPSKIQVIGSGYNRTIFYDRGRQIEDGKMHLIFAGKVSEKKGVFSLIRSLEYLPYDASELSLEIAGGYGNEQEYQAIQTLARASKYPINFLGRLTQEELAIAFSNSDVFVLPSFYEGLPLVIIEAIACGLKVVSTELPGIREWMDERIPDNGICYVTPPAFENTDEAKEGELPAFEKRLAEQLQKCIDEKSKMLDLSEISWEGICHKIALNQ